MMTRKESQLTAELLKLTTENKLLKIALKECEQDYFKEVDKNCEKMFLASVNDSDAYRWHDLREEPYDLPEVNKNVLFAFDWGEEHPYSLSRHEYIAGYMGSRHRWHDVDGTYQGEYPDIIAWKEIEPFNAE